MKRRLKPPLSLKDVKPVELLEEDAQCLGEAFEKAFQAMGDDLGLEEVMGKIEEAVEALRPQVQEAEKRAKERKGR